MSSAVWFSRACILTIAIVKNCVFWLLLNLSVIFFLLFFVVMARCFPPGRGVCSFFWHVRGVLSSSLGVLNRWWKGKVVEL